MSIKRIVAWADRTGKRIAPDPERPWHSWAAHLGLSMLASLATDWFASLLASIILGSAYGYGIGLTVGTATAWWCFSKYEGREERQERDGMEFERGDLAGPLANVILWSVAWAWWIYYSLVWRW